MSARKSIVSSAVAAIQVKLFEVNGRRRERIVCYREAVQAIREALRDGYGIVGDSDVPGCYEYSTAQTKVTALAGNGAVIVSIFLGDANQDAGSGLPWPRSASEEGIAEYLDTLTRRPYQSIVNGMRMSRNTAKRIVAAQDHADAIGAIERIPAEYRDSETLVTAADSLGAVNCVGETQRVQSWFPGRDAVPAKEILAAIVAKAPSMIPFAVRAIQHAHRRIGAA